MKYSKIISHTLLILGIIIISTVVVLVVRYDSHISEKEHALSTLNQTLAKIPPDSIITKNPASFITEIPPVTESENGKFYYDRALEKASSTQKFDPKTYRIPIYQPTSIPHDLTDRLDKLSYNRYSWPPEQIEELKEVKKLLEQGNSKTTFADFNAISPSNMVHLHGASIIITAYTNEIRTQIERENFSDAVKTLHDMYIFGTNLFRNDSIGSLRNTEELTLVTNVYKNYSVLAEFLISKNKDSYTKIRPDLVNFTKRFNDDYLKKLFAYQVSFNNRRAELTRQKKDSEKLNNKYELQSFYKDLELKEWKKTEPLNYYWFFLTSGWELVNTQIINTQANSLDMALATEKNNLIIPSEYISRNKKDETEIKSRTFLWRERSFHWAYNNINHSIGVIDEIKNIKSYILDIMADNDKK